MGTILSVFIMFFGMALFFGMDYLFKQSLFKDMEEIERIFG